MVKVHKHSELPKLSPWLRLRDVADGLNFRGERGDTMSVNVMSKKFQVADTEETFVGVYDNSVWGEAFENSS